MSSQTDSGAKTAPLIFLVKLLDRGDRTALSWKSLLIW